MTQPSNYPVGHSHGGVTVPPQLAEMFLRGRLTESRRALAAETEHRIDFDRLKLQVLGRLPQEVGEYLEFHEGILRDTPAEKRGKEPHPVDLLIPGFLPIRSLWIHGSAGVSGAGWEQTGLGGEQWFQVLPVGRERVCTLTLEHAIYLAGTMAAESRGPGGLSPLVEVHRLSRRTLEQAAEAVANAAKEREQGSPRWPSRPVLMTPGQYSRLFGKLEGIAAMVSQMLEAVEGAEGGRTPCGPCDSPDYCSPFGPPAVPDDADDNAA